MKPLNKQFAPKSVMPEKVIQFGEGNFLRAFVDWIIWNMDQKTDFNGSVVVVQPIEKGMVDSLNAQDCLYHVNLQGRENGKPVNTLERIDVISRALNPYTQHAAFMALADQPEMRFVISNTTEAGIAFDPSCKLEDAPASSYPGKLVQLLYRRYQTFNGDPTKGLIIFPCELIFLNGHVLKDCIKKYIDLWNLGADFKKWVEEACGVYATLVDRIVPGFPRKDIAEIQEKICYRDNMVVQAENFHLWVIEAPREVAKEFPADKAGLHVLFVPSEVPYHKRKVTLLNGPHTVLSPVAFLSGVDIVRDACNHEIISRYIHKVQFDELMQTLDLPIEQLEKFAGDVLERFDKFGLAAIITYYKGGKRKDGVEIVPNDDPKIMDLLKELWATGDTQKVTDGVLGAEFIWQENLNKIPGLNAMLKQDLDLIESLGMLEAVKSIL